MSGNIKKLKITKSWKQRRNIGDNICILGTAPPVSAAAFFAEKGVCTDKEKTRRFLVVLRGIKNKKQRM